MLKYTPDHEWLLIENDSATVGITQFAQEQLGDLVFVELPKLGAVLQSGAAAAVVELVKAASDVYAPIGGEVTEVNQRVTEDPDFGQFRSGRQRLAVQNEDCGQDATGQTNGRAGLPGSG